MSIPPESQKKIDHLIGLLQRRLLDDPEVLAFIEFNGDDAYLMGSVEYARNGRMDRGVISSLRIWHPGLVSGQAA